jgi:hypothetical protein
MTADSDHDALYYRKDWMSDDQWECAQMFADVVGGFHHVSGTFKPHGTGVKVSDYGGRWATFDFDALTRIVLLAHDRMIRVALEPTGPRMVGFVLFKRHTREGSMYERHPTIEQAIALHRRARDA